MSAGRLEDLFASRIAVAVPAVIAPALAADLRARLERVGYARYALVDRGSYEVIAAPAPAEPAIAVALEALAALAIKVTGRPLALADARVLRLGAGDYLLAHHDRAHDAPLVEVTLDLSPARVSGADVHYRRDGQVVFRFESTPGAAAIVERGPTTTCSHAYLSKRLAAASVVRLVARFGDRA